MWVVTFNDHNEYLSPVWNRFLRSSTSRYVLFVNPDLVMHRGEPFLKAMKTMDENDDYVIAGRRNARYLLSELKRLTPPVRPADLVVFLNVIRDNQWLQNEFEIEPAMVAPYISGECIVLHRERALLLGGFDERLPLYFNDNEFCFRALDNSKKAPIHLPR